MKVKCIDKNGYKHLTIGKAYKVIGESKEDYKILADDRNDYWYEKYLFEVVERRFNSLEEVAALIPDLWIETVGGNVFKATQFDFNRDRGEFRASSNTASYWYGGSYQIKAIHTGEPVSTKLQKILELEEAVKKAQKQIQELKNESN